MSKPTLSGSIIRPGVRSVLMTAEAIGFEIDYNEDTVNVNITPEEYMKKTTEQKIAILNDNGKHIWDSHAIMCYLVSQYGKDDSLYPKDNYARALVDQVLFFENGILDTRSRSLYMANRKDPELLNEKKEDVYRAYGHMDKFLEKNSYLSGNSLTIADLSVAPALASVNLMLPVDAAKYPKLADWFSRMQNLPYYEKVNGAALRRSKEWM